MNYVNNWLRAIDLEQGATSCPLDLPDGEYRLTLADAAAGATRWEIVDAVVAAGSATLTRAREGTADQDWPTGSVIYCSVTAEALEQMSAGGGASTVQGRALMDAYFSLDNSTFAVPAGTGAVYADQDDDPPDELVFVLPELPISDTYEVPMEFDIDVEQETPVRFEFDATLQALELPWFTVFYAGETPSFATTSFSVALAEPSVVSLRARMQRGDTLTVYVTTKPAQSKAGTTIGTGYGS